MREKSTILSLNSLRIEIGLKPEIVKKRRTSYEAIKLTRDILTRSKYAPHG
jgi:uncharacterized protein YwbE